MGLFSTLYYTHHYIVGCYDLLHEETFGRKVEKARLYLRLTKTDTEKIYSIDHNTFSRIESGELKYNELTTLNQERLKKLFTEAFKE